MDALGVHWDWETTRERSRRAGCTPLPISPLWDSHNFMLRIHPLMEDPQKVINLKKLMHNMNCVIKFLNNLYLKEQLIFQIDMINNWPSLPPTPIITITGSRCWRNNTFILSFLTLMLRLALISQKSLNWTSLDTLMAGSPNNGQPTMDEIFITAPFNAPYIHKIMDQFPTLIETQPDPIHYMTRDEYDTLVPIFSGISQMFHNGTGFKHLVQYLRDLQHNYQEYPPNQFLLAHRFWNAMSSVQH